MALAHQEAVAVRPVRLAAAQRHDVVVERRENLGRREGRRVVPDLGDIDQADRLEPDEQRLLAEQRELFRRQRKRIAKLSVKGVRFHLITPLLYDISFSADAETRALEIRGPDSSFEDGRSRAVRTRCPTSRSFHFRARSRNRRSAGLEDVLLDDEDRQVPVFDLFDRLEEAVDHDRSKPKRRLVQSQNLRARHGSPDRKHLLLPSGQCRSGELLALPRGSGKGRKPLATSRDAVPERLCSSLRREVLPDRHAAEGCLPSGDWTKPLATTT